jgi:hypothetical protein
MYRFGADGIVGDDQEILTPAVQVMICKYILTCPLELPANDNTLMTYREFKDAGPLISYFTTNTNKTIETTFSGNLAGLKTRGQDIGGKLLASDIYDLSVQFFAFPRVPVLVNFNDRDDSAASFLDMECLAMTGTLLTGKLIAPVPVP